MEENYKNGWTQYQKLVLSQLERHHETLDQLGERISDLRVEISALKVQAGMWGLFAGMIPVVISLVITFIGRGK